MPSSPRSRQYEDELLHRYDSRGDNSGYICFPDLEFTWGNWDVCIESGRPEDAGQAARYRIRIAERTEREHGWDCCPSRCPGMHPRVVNSDSH